MSRDCNLFVYKDNIFIARQRNSRAPLCITTTILYIITELGFSTLANIDYNKWTRTDITLYPDFMGI